MKKLHKLAAAVAVAAGIALSPQTNAEMQIGSDTRGDTLLFPVFYGYGENYFTISNSANAWIQGHVRFRGAAWSGELLDFDVILSPGDVFVFRLADVDGDGFWEIDQSLDVKNFEYTGLAQVSSCSLEDPAGPTAAPVANRLAKNLCMDQNGRPGALNLGSLVPVANNERIPPGNITPGLIEHHRHIGYVEFIGEAVLVGMSHDMMDELVCKPTYRNYPNCIGAPHQRKVGSQVGTTTWSWYRDDPAKLTSISPAGRQPLADVPNALSGTAFITAPGQKHGLGYNAEAIIDFRTNANTHRVESYNVIGTTGVLPANVDFEAKASVLQTGVVLHHEDASLDTGAAKPYVYLYQEQPDNFEGRISFNNTFGPTLADGDDYDVSTQRWTQDSGVNDNFDMRGINAAGIADGVAWTSSRVNSVAEVEEAIRDAEVPRLLASSSQRQMFNSFYTDGLAFDAACSGLKRLDNPSCSSSSLQSWYFAWAPTKFFYGENVGYYATTNFANYIERAVQELLNLAKPLTVSLWDIEENTPRSSCTVSPCPIIRQGLPLREELAVFNIKTLKDRFGNGSHQSWTQGRAEFMVNPLDNISSTGDPTSATDRDTFPILMYTFEWGTDGYLSHWRPMSR